MTHTVTLKQLATELKLASQFTKDDDKQLILVLGDDSCISYKVRYTKNDHTPTTIIGCATLSKAINEYNGI